MAWAKTVPAVDVQGSGWHNRLGRGESRARGGPAKGSVGIADLAWEKPCLRRPYKSPVSSSLLSRRDKAAGRGNLVCAVPADLAPRYIIRPASKGADLAHAGAEERHALSTLSGRGGQKKSPKRWGPGIFIHIWKDCRLTSRGKAGRHSRQTDWKRRRRHGETAKQRDGNLCQAKGRAV